MSDKVVIYPPAMARLGHALAEKLGCPAACTANITDADPDAIMQWSAFPNGDPDLKLRADALIGKHVILLISQHDPAADFVHLSLLLWLQRFYVPTASEALAKGKWKKVIGEGAFEVKSVGMLTVCIPWYRYCQMDRTSRWAYLPGKEKPWTNGVADGPFVDVASAQTYAALLSAEPPAPPGATTIGAPPLPPKELLVIDIHDDLNGKPVVESALAKTGKWANPSVEYDLIRGTGTYFASAFQYFLEHTFELGDLASTFVIFPDAGAYARFHTMVEAQLRGIAADNVLYIEKKRVGSEVTSGTELNYHTAGGGVATRDCLPAGSNILIPDDFTNSGSTLFNGASTVKKHTQGPCIVHAFVTHFVAKYEQGVVDKFVQTIYSEGSAASDLDVFHTTDSIPNATTWLEEATERRVTAGQPRRVHVHSLAPVIAGWILARPKSAASAVDCA